VPNESKWNAPRHSHFFAARALSCGILAFSIAAWGQPPAEKPDASGEQAQGQPPALVEAAPVARGRIAPESEFIATVYFDQVANVASESRGLVEAVKSEGRRPCGGRSGTGDAER